MRIALFLVFGITAPAPAPAQGPPAPAPLGAWTPIPELPVPPRNPAQERWTGLRLGPDSVAARASGIPRVLSTDSLDRVLRSARARAAGPLYLPLDVSTREEPRIADLTFDGGDVRSLRP